MQDRKFRFYAVKLSGIIVLIFLAQVLIVGFTSWFVLDGNAYSQPWRFVSSVFLHGGLGHLVLNLFALLLFGSILERFIGGQRMLHVFFVTGILANLISVNFYDSSLGASGAIFGIIGALIVIKPMMAVWAFGMPMPLFIAGILWIGADLLGTYGFFTGNPINNTGNIAHLSGIFFGFIFGYFYRGMIKGRKSGPKIKIDESSIQLWEDFHLK
jgi:uncharacterized protein